MTGLTADDRLAYWNEMEDYARRQREAITRQQRLRDLLDAAGVEDPLREQILAREQARQEAELGPEPGPDQVVGTRRAS